MRIFGKAAGGGAIASAVLMTTMAPSWAQQADPITVLPRILIGEDNVEGAVEAALKARRESPNAKVVIEGEQLNQFNDLSAGDAIRRLPGVTFPGVNRPREVKPGLGRTAPSAMNKQEVQLYVVLAEGAYVYEAEQNQLRPVVAGDVRAKVAQGAGAHAAVTIIYVADSNLDYAQVDTGFIGQNVYLFAASEGLNAWIYALHGADVAGALKLPEGMKGLYGQSVGYKP